MTLIRKIGDRKALTADLRGMLADLNSTLSNPSTRDFRVHKFFPRPLQTLPGAALDCFVSQGNQQLHTRSKLTGTLSTSLGDPMRRRDCISTLPLAFFAFVLIALLGGCGGVGGSANAPTPTPTRQPSTHRRQAHQLQSTWFMHSVGTRSSFSTHIRRKGRCSPWPGRSPQH